MGGGNSKDASTPASNSTATAKPTQEKEELSAAEQAEIKKEVETSNEIRLMVTGKCGVGKSTLLNGILGKKVFEEGDDFDPQTVEVDSRTVEKAGINITVFDTPGLQESPKNDAKYLADMKEKCTEIDLLVYCINMSENRADLHIHNSAMQKITETLSPAVWEHAVIVLTFANTFENRLKDKGKSNREVKSDFKGKIKEWEDTFRAALRSLKVSSEVCNGIKAYPAGIAEQPSLISQEYWLSNFWMESVLAMKPNAQIAMVKMSFQRFKDKGDIKPEDFEGDISDQPLVLTKLDKAVVGGAASTGIVAGATTGALIGALAIGIPSFGIAAGLGLVLGGAIGAGAGLGTGAGAGLIIALFRRNKKKKEVLKIRKDALQQLGHDLAGN